jgi:hypothetical protein
MVSCLHTEGSPGWRFLASSTCVFCHSPGEAEPIDSGAEGEKFGVGDYITTIRMLSMVLHVYVDRRYMYCCCTYLI